MEWCVRLVGRSIGRALGSGLRSPGEIGLLTQEPFLRSEGRRAELARSFGK